MISSGDPTVKISEPGRTPLHLVIRRPIAVGRDCDGLLLADAELSRRHLQLSATAGRVSWTSADLPWPHFFSDLSGLGGSAAVSAGTVVITACRRLAPP